MRAEAPRLIGPGYRRRVSEIARLLDPAAVDAVITRVARDVDAGLLPAAQFAIAGDGRILAGVQFGGAGPGTRFCLYSATKPVVAATVWRLIAAGELDPAERVATWFPAFAANGKSDITLEQVMLHTAGFPTAPMGPSVWSDRTARQERMAAWRLNWEPGTRYEYHPTSAHWVLAELIETVTGMDFRDAVHALVTAPLGLPRIVGLPLDSQDDIAALELVGEPATSAELMAAFGVAGLPSTEVTDESVTRFNEPDVRAVGVPGGGGFARATDMAMFYQHLLHGPDGVWPADLLSDVTARVRVSLRDPFGVPANRTLGLVVAGGDGLSHLRGFGRTVSPTAFGHNGAGGQICWADPATGLSFAFLTSGYERHEVRQRKRTSALASLAAVTIRSRPTA
jgi:CubicO group peptidase (beta-lactamase class C family)